MDAKKYFPIAKKYAEDCVTGAVVIGADAVNACQRFLDDLKRPDLEFRTKDADAVCSLMEGLLVHRKGEELDGKPLPPKQAPAPKPVEVKKEENNG